jgi:hypothetical protein
MGTVHVAMYDVAVATGAAVTALRCDRDLVLVAPARWSLTFRHGESNAGSKNSQDPDCTFRG